MALSFGWCETSELPDQPAGSELGVSDSAPLPRPIVVAVGSKRFHGRATRVPHAMTVRLQQRILPMSRCFSSERQVLGKLQSSFDTTTRLTLDCKRIVQERFCLRAEVSAVFQVPIFL